MPNTVHQAISKSFIFSRNQWYSAAPLAKIEHHFRIQGKQKPFATKILDQNITIVPSFEGYKAVQDKCCHRGAKLSMGTYHVNKQQLQCKYHGNNFKIY